MSIWPNVRRGGRRAQRGDIKEHTLRMLLTAFDATEGHLPFASFDKITSLVNGPGRWAFLSA